MLRANMLIDKHIFSRYEANIERFYVTKETKKQCEIDRKRCKDVSMSYC